MYQKSILSKETISLKEFTTAGTINKSTEIYHIREDGELLPKENVQKDCYDDKENIVKSGLPDSGEDADFISSFGYLDVSFFFQFRF